MTLKMGICLLCRTLRPLTEHHVSHPATGDRNSIMICRPCHKMVDGGLKEEKPFLTEKESPCPGSGCLKYTAGCIDCPSGLYPPYDEPEKEGGINSEPCRECNTSVPYGPGTEHEVHPTVCPRCGASMEVK